LELLSQMPMDRRASWEKSTSAPSSSVRYTVAKVLNTAHTPEADIFGISLLGGVQPNGGKVHRKLQAASRNQKECFLLPTRTKLGRRVRQPAPKARSSVNHHRQNIPTKVCIVAWKGGKKNNIVTLLDCLLHPTDMTVIEGGSYRKRESERGAAACRQMKK
jgi:hypothetical protein